MNIVYIKKKRPSIVPSGLIFHVDAGNSQSYPGTGTTWYDISSNSYNGTLTNGPTYDSANKGSIVFDGNNDYVDFGNVLNIGTNPFTLQITLRIHPNGHFNNYAKVAAKGYYLQGGWTIIAGKNPNGNYSLGLQYGSGSWTGIGGGSISPGQFTVFTVTRDSSNILTSYNGNTTIASTTETFNFTTTRQFVIGKVSDVSTEHFRGNVYTFMQYNRALSSNEVSRNFNALRGRFGL